MSPAKKTKTAAAVAKPARKARVAKTETPASAARSAPKGLCPRPHTTTLPVYEPGRPLEEVAREFGFPDADLLMKLASNENPNGPSPKAIMAMMAACSRMHLYPDGGCFYLRQKLSRKLGVAPDQLIFGSGSNEIIEFLGHVFLGPGLNLVMSQQAFVVYKLVGLAMEAEVREAPMKDFVHDLDAMLAMVDDNTRLFFIANPNNPTGTLLDTEALRTCLGKIPPHVLVVIDEAYVELIDDDEDVPASLDLMREFPNVVLLRTFSKAYGLAGLRIGYGITRAETVKWMEKYRQPFNVSSMAQIAASAALDDSEHLFRTRYNNEAGLKYLEVRFRAMKVDFPESHTNFILVKTGRGREIFRELQKQGIIVRPMDGYGLPEHLRISVGTPEQNRACVAAIQKIIRPEMAPPP
jgi:histidinol-phosphate aminotransferase